MTSRWGATSAGRVPGPSFRPVIFAKAFNASSSRMSPSSVLLMLPFILIHQDILCGSHGIANPRCDNSNTQIIILSRNIL